MTDPLAVNGVIETFSHFKDNYWLLAVPRSVDRLMKGAGNEGEERQLGRGKRETIPSEALDKIRNVPPPL